MTNRQLSLCLGLAVAGLFAVLTSSSSPVAAEDGAKKVAAKASDAAQEAREKAFIETLSNAVMVGKWRLTKDGELGRELGDKYTLGAVKKIKGDRWTIEARIEYGEKDVRIPVPVQVTWADDTPVISVERLPLPGLGTYTARVLVHRDHYAGTWFGKDYGGLMSGVIEKAKPKTP
ncbi:MAG: hypothetical protein AAF517_00860 [Planctomycetota bacterium]